MNEVFFILVGIVMGYITYKAYEMITRKSDTSTKTTTGSGGGGNGEKPDINKK